ncbi:MAG TPA: helix-turn-helix transcriptional regulator [Candidatus Faecenecus gallistercoris]|jgi:DNA-binding transcriptional ArsR family regulator|uniref:Helix-turn-helix transcriptional regulator n=1 Tax=Candidatus Faecenecus gallistercoris TaxID=2840793 RepID=A0A9D0YYE6_9FIRM|nr:metalloregulator ArsR/SmtB family transcription factor [Bacillota bacterium]MDY4050970.1 metalloregulator ArsR/SmtB family transcription factor [Candidatus Faecenecus gallistercoris]CDE07609.1 putative transcriptional regulator [Bacillus sp. CAG:988]MDD7101926.1 metalloregulator ArsR/SmtB family transcription factor [Bacillota bacterium]PWL70916.1 MAG: transcriptional regulator [Bacillota bacterium]
MARNEFSCDCNVIHQEAVNQVLARLPDEQTFYKLADLYKLIGDTTRCRILFALDQNEMCVCDLANVLNMTKSSISHQLAVLRRSGIVKCRKNGKEVYYTLDDDHIVQLFEIGLEHINHKG